MEKSIFTKRYQALTKRLREMREHAGLTQRELAGRMKTLQTVIARLEQGERRLDLIEFYWLCKATGVDPKKAAVDVIKTCLAIDDAKPAKRGS